MNKSIEDIWNEGFINESAGTIPKVNNLYNQKSKSIIEQMGRMVKWNIKFLYGMAVFILLMGIFLSLPIWLIAILVLLFVAPAIHTQRQLKDGVPENNYQNCYDYLTVFRSWISDQMSKNIKLARYYYPVSILAASAIIWFSEGRNEVLEELLLNFPDIPMFFGIPLFFALPVLVITLLMGIFAGRIYRLDVGLIYGRVLRRLDEILRDLEELR